MIRRQVYGNNHPTVAQSLEALGKLMEMQNKAEQAKVISKTNIIHTFVELLSRSGRCLS